VLLRKLALLALILLLLGVFPMAYAQDVDAFPTVDTLNEAVVPPRDLLDLAQRLEGVETVEAPPVNPASLTVGTIRTLWATNSSADLSFQFDAELRVVGDHIYIWVEQGRRLEQGALERLASEFDSRVYDQTRELWGSEASPGVDGDPRIHAVFVGDLGFSVGAYYASKHSYPIEAVPTSNEMEMLFFNLSTIDYLVGTDIITTITAHEFQHMIRANVDQNEDGWMDEGFSTFTEWYLGDNNLGFVDQYLFNPNVQLNTWTEDGNTSADYGASQLWVTYLYERFGVEGLQALSADPANGLYGVDNLVAEYGTDANTVFADWIVANYLVDPKRTNNPVYGYTQLRGLSGVGTVVYDTLPVEDIRSIRQYAAQYIRVEDLGDASSLTLEVTAPGTVGLAPTKSPSATPLWYSNRGDDSNTHLTIPLDLTTMQSPVLNYDVWYHIENLWDYGYTMVSTDDGATWDILFTPEMTDENPHFNGYGFGYTGRSSSWVSEQIDLSNYAGQNVLLRFEMIYDDAVNQPGMFIDYIALVDDTTQQAMYNDFSDPALMTDFQAAGWLLTDNRLPQSVWVQAIQESGGEATVTRWLHTGGTETYPLPLASNASRVTVALSPFAPTTTVPVEITLNITGN
jgi:immune inhibitor A